MASTKPRSTTPVKASPPPRKRRDRDDIRELLLESATIEFGAHGFEGASTRSIATRVRAHQPQINYHFASKQDLWRETVSRLFRMLDGAMDGVDDIADPGQAFAEGIRRLVRFAAEHPDLNRIMVQEASSPNERMEWIIETHTRTRFEARRAKWRALREAGVAAPIDDDVVHYVLIGAASLPYVNAPEARLLFGDEPNELGRIEAHANSLVAMLLPGLGKRPRSR